MEKKEKAQKEKEKENKGKEHGILKVQAKCGRWSRKEITLI